MRSKPRLAILCIALLLVAGGVAAVIVALCGGDEYRILTSEEVLEVVAANEGLTDEQSMLVDACVSLVGRVPYFWGGKSTALGWDERWNYPAEVTSAGSETTGTVRPFGLDCSGYVTWAFVQIGLSPEEAAEVIGHGTYNQWMNSAEIRWGDVRVGDFAFQYRYPGNSGNHIGICIGFFDGEPVFAHCSNGENNVVVSTVGDVFNFVRRPQPFLPSES